MFGYIFNDVPCFLVCRVISAGWREGVWSVHFRMRHSPCLFQQWLIRFTPIRLLKLSSAIILSWWKERNEINFRMSVKFVFLFQCIYRSIHFYDLLFVFTPYRCRVVRIFRVSDCSGIEFCPLPHVRNSRNTYYGICVNSSQIMQKVSWTEKPR